MKKYFLILAAACTFTFAACVDKDDTASTTNTKQFNFKNVEPFTIKMAPVKEGQVTTIKVGGKVICETSIPMQYALPNGQTEEISYAPQKKGAKTGGSTLTQMVLAFEDVESNGTANSRNDSTPIVDENGAIVHDRFGNTLYNYTYGSLSNYGDFNDFVCYVQIWNYKANENGIDDSTRVVIQPLAYGGVHKIDFTLNLGNGQSVVINDVRNSLFNGITGFINTTNRTYSYNSTQNYVNTNSLDYCRLYEIKSPINLNEITAKITTTISAGYAYTFDNGVKVDSVYHNSSTIEHYAAMNMGTVSLSDKNKWQNTKTGAPVGIAIWLNAAQYCFQYPMEGGNINDCYTFYDWIFGNATWANTFILAQPDNTKVFTKVRDIVNVDCERLFPGFYTNN